MAITVTPNLTDVSMCESTTGWAGGISQLLAQNTMYVQGSYALAAWIDNTTSAIEYFTITAANFTGKHVYAWMSCSGRVDTKANGGYRIVLYTDASNYATFFVGGNDTHGTGWNLLCCSADADPDLETGTFNPASVTRVGIQFKTITAGTKQGQTYMHNCFWDAVRYGTGLTITSGASDAIDFEDIFAVDDSSTYKYGVVQKAYGAYIVQGKLTFGSDTSGSIDFADSNQVVLFPNNDKASDDFYGIAVLGNSGGTTNFVLGAKSGDSGISGCTLKAIGAKTFTLDVSDTDNDVVKLYGCNFINAGVMTLPVEASNKEVLNCNITMHDGVVISTCDIAYCNFIEADDEAAIMASTSHHISDCSFIANPNAIRITNPGTYAFDNMKFSGNTVDIDNTSGGSVTVNCSNGSNPTTYTGSTTIVNTVTLTLTGLVAGSEVRIYDAGTTDELDGIESSDTEFEFGFEYAASSYVDIVVHHVDYEYLRIEDYLLLSTPSTIPIQQRYDRNYANPA